MSRVIVHLDADAFFASVAQAADKRLRGKAVAVGGDKRGIIASASYEARKLGVETPMPTVRARKLCPKLIVVPADYDLYEKFSRKMFSFAQDFTPDVEITSIDEGYIDLSCVRKPPKEVADKIRQAIGQSLKISVSEGIGANKLVSQIASKFQKPASFIQVPEGRETFFLDPLPNMWLPGVGPKTSDKLDSAGLASIGQIARTPLDFLHLVLGSQAPTLRQFANGIDERPLIPASVPAKSYGEQQTFNEDQTNEVFIEATLRRMADHLMAKVREDGKSIRTLTVKVRNNDMAEDQCGESLLEPTDLETDLYPRLRVLMKQAWKRRVSLRMVSLKLSNVYEGLFRAELCLDQNPRQQEARHRLALIADQLRRIHGAKAVLRGHDFYLDKIPVRKPKPPVRIVIKSSPARARATTCVPLNVHSYYSFQDSTLSIAALVGLAKKHQLKAVALTDTGNLHGAVEFSVLAKKAGIKPILGAELKIDGSRLWLYVQNQKGYQNLCRILSSKEKRVDGHAEGLLAVSENIGWAEMFPKRFYRAISSPSELREKSQWPRVPVLATHYAEPSDRWKFDVVQSIRTLTLLKQAHPQKRMKGEFHFRSPSQLSLLFPDHPEVLNNSVELAERCDFQLALGPPQFPAFKTPDGSTPHEFLRRLVHEGLRRRYPKNFSTLQGQIEEELKIISDVGYEEYFLVVWGILQDCKKEGIEWITRGSAADSLVCYCLGISDVCPIRFDLYFRRFLNKERMALNKLPDIDIDFPHDRKDDVVDLIFAKYGPEHCAVVGGFSTFQARSAFAEIGKVLGMAEREVRRFTDHFPWSFGGGWVPNEPTPKGGSGLREMLLASPENRDLPLNEEPYKTALDMAEFLDGFPRYPKMHPCGVVLSRQPMHELAPTFVSNKGYPTTHFEMDAVEMIGLVKIDVLAQGGLAVMRDTKDALKTRGIEVDLGSLEPWEDPQVWEMIAAGGSRAVHHIESPAMVGLCKMCNVRDIDCLVAIVSVIRPGAANENKKQSFALRYQGLQSVTYPDPSLEECLRSTFGLVVYEEHILQICEAFAGLPPGRADVLRRALSKQKYAVIEEIGKEFVASARARGHSDGKIVEVWNLVIGFAGYAFCKAHSTAYGVEAYQAAWLKRYHPAEFMAAVLSNGKGFYDALVYVLESHRLGLQMLPPWINEPGPKFKARGRFIRVPVTRVKGLTERTRECIIEEFNRGPFQSLADFYRRVNPLPEEVEAMIRVGAFDGFGTNRTAQFWECQFLHRSVGDASEPGQGWLLPPPSLEKLPEVSLAEPSRLQRLQWEAELLDFPASGHPLELHNDIHWESYCPVNRLHQFIGQEVTMCGLVIEQRIHHQITGEPMKFLTLADWTGMVETELFAQTYKSYGLATVRYPVLEVSATVEPYENGRGFSLRVLRAGQPRLKKTT